MYYCCRKLLFLKSVTYLCVCCFYSIQPRKSSLYIHMLVTSFIRVLFLEPKKKHCCIAGICLRVVAVYFHFVTPSNVEQPKMFPAPLLFCPCHEELGEELFCGATGSRLCLFIFPFVFFSVSVLYFCI